MKRPAINDVFKPRSSKVNKKIYVERPDYEKSLHRALEGSLYPIIFGNSGSGKSWLYKKVLSDQKAEYRIANCGNLTNRSLFEEIYSATIPSKNRRLDEITEELNTDISAGFAKGGLKNQKKYKVISKDLLLESFKYLREKAKKNNAVFVIDNIDFIFNNEKYMNELASIIMLSDDSRYSLYNIKIIIVGIPSVINDYYLKTKNISSVANRLRELPEISNMSKKNVEEFTKTGFVTLLKIKISPKIFRVWVNHIHRITLGNPQCLHEYCLELAYMLSENNWNPTIKMLQEADKEWLRIHLRKSYTSIQQIFYNFGSEKNIINNVMYVLGKLSTNTFNKEIINNELKKYFPQTVLKQKINYTEIFSELCNTNNPIIKKSLTKGQYEFSEPRHLMCLRTMLRKSKSNEEVRLLIFKI